MTQYTLMTTPNEADEIMSGLKSFVFRNNRFTIGYADTLTFQAYKAGKPTVHPISGRKYKVTYVSSDAPLEEGWKVIGFKEV